ncbi:MAG: reverse transcriptase/maturase family protein [Candidatus Paceibacterota bacterium]
MYDNIISIENLLHAWKEFLKGKRKKDDVQRFYYQLFDNILLLHNDLKNQTYKHGGYYAFNISDPKPRNIHKATVRDRLLHHAIYRVLYLFFDNKFIYDSYSCRKFKGTHRAIERFRKFTYKASLNNTKTLWILKCDIKKFFASIDHVVLLNIVQKYIKDEKVIDLINRVVTSFESTSLGKGLPLGNLTSQILVNIYMNEFDQWMKHEMKIKYYIRYADDFVVLYTDKRFLEDLIPKISEFLDTRLKLSMHPNKMFIKTLASGVDFLGWVHFPEHRVLRTATKKRMFRNLTEKNLSSYVGLCKHGNAYKSINDLDSRLRGNDRI